jgi:hypothetical protein
MTTYESRIDPTTRIDIFRRRTTELADEAGLPEYDHVLFDEAQGMLGFLWEHPRFMIAVDLRRSNVLGTTANDLLASWHAKFSADWRARLARGAIRREEPTNLVVGADGLSRRAQ